MTGSRNGSYALRRGSELRVQGQKSSVREVVGTWKTRFHEREAVYRAVVGAFVVDLSN